MQLIDISHALNEKTPIFPGDIKTTLTREKTPDRDHYTAYSIKSGFHTGTHVDAPMHLTADSRTIGSFPLDRFHGRGVLLDVRGQDVIDMKPIYDQVIKPGDCVLLFTGHDKKFHETDYFTDYPYITAAFAAFLADRGINMLGLDTPSPDRPPYTLHKQLLERGVMILENLTNLESLISVLSFHIMALPLKLAAEASFVRAVCVLEE